MSRKAAKRAEMPVLTQKTQNERGQPMWTLEKCREVADEIKVVTIEEAREMPGILGKICAAALLEKGFYTCVFKQGRKEKKILFELKGGQ